MGISHCFDYNRELVPTFSVGITKEMAEKRFKFSIQFKLFLILISIVVFISSTIVFFFVTWTKNELYGEIEKRGKIEAKSLAFDAKYGVITEDTVILDHFVAGRMVKPDIMFIVIENNDGAVLTKSIKEKCFHCDELTKKDLLVDIGEAILEPTIISKEGHDIYIFAAPIVTERSEIPNQEKILENALIFTDKPTEPLQLIRGMVYVGVSLVNLNKRVQDTLAVSVLIIFIVVIVSLTISSYFIKAITVPIRKVALAANEISNGNLAMSVEVFSSDEIGEMAENFNKMTTTLKITIDELTDFKNKLEMKVKKRTMELELALRMRVGLLKKLANANKELESFAYVVSHDLKAPLRGINSLATWIYKDYGDKFDEDGKEQIQLLIGRVKRMYNLIDGILQYSRTGQAREEISKVDTNILIKEIIDILAPPDHIEIKIKDKLPIISYGKVHMGQIFQNLLSNAIKFIDKPKGKIIIGCDDKDDYFWKFSVTDNGSGIDEKHFEKIFTIFQTLSPRDHFESTGIGLTVSKKIVEIYGGSIEVKSKIGEGSTFTFSVPKDLRIKAYSNDPKDKES